MRTRVKINVWSVIPALEMKYNPLGPTKSGSPDYMKLDANTQVSPCASQPRRGTTFYTVLSGPYKGQMFSQTNADSRKNIVD
jgi:hypothetical protein